LPNDKDDRDKILELLNKLTRYTLTEKQTGNFLTREANRHWIVAYAAVTGTDRSIGTELIRDLLNSRHVVRIHLNFRNPQGVLEPNAIFNTENLVNASTPGVGSSTNVNLNNVDNYYTIVADRGTNWDNGLNWWSWGLNWPIGVTTRDERMPHHIILGHELIHALRVTLGQYVLNEEPNKGYNFIKNLDGSIGYMPDPLQPYLPYRISLEEFETMGVPYRLQLGGEVTFPTQWLITENALRIEHDYPIRITRGGWIKE